jgi:dTMP kinase
MIISFEGLDGCGKSTQIGLLTVKLQETGKKVAVLREPGGNPISEKIREMLLDKKNMSMSKETELLLYTASRAQLVREEIEPLLNDDTIIILDRFADSTTAYQGYGRGLDLNIIGVLNKFVTSNFEFMPDLTFFLDMPAEKSLSRVLSRGEEINRMESSDKEFFERVRNGFIEISKNEPERVICINASESVINVFSQIENVLKLRDIL